MTLCRVQDTGGAAAQRRTAAHAGIDAALRPMPYPYRATVAICSDLDETPDRVVYWETTRFLNTTDSTSMGPGIGLEVGNSIYFDMPPDQFAYWNTDDRGRAMVHALIRSGHIDCLHSFGDLATTRRHAGRALDELDRHACRLEVWVDHSEAPSNFGADIMRGSGDVPGAEAYHADLTCAQGVRYVSRGRVTSVVGQDIAPSLGGLYTWRHPLASIRTLVKESVKQALGRRGHAKYGIHAPNRILRNAQLRDGRPIVEMLRCNPHWRGIEHGDTAAGLGEVLNPQFLDRLVARGAACILYTHLGKIADRGTILPERTRAALRLLAQYKCEGRILVTTTRRLLGMRRALGELTVTARKAEFGMHIDVRTPVDAGRGNDSHVADLSGLTCYVPEPDACRMTVNGKDVEELRVNAPDETGRASVSIPWKSLTFPAL